jgi:superfamily II DNA or RNA helicase
MLKIILPPNLETTASRDAIAVRLEWNPGGGPVDAALPALAVIQRLAPGPDVPRFVQLTRAQLRALVEASAGQPFVYLASRPAQPLVWSGNKLPGVTEHLLPTILPVATDSAGVAAEVTRPKQTPPPHVGGYTPEAGAPPVTPPQVDGSEHFLAISLPSRNHHAYDELLELIKAQGFTLETSNLRWWLRDRHKTLAFLGEHWAALKDWGAVFTENFEKNTARIGRAEVVTEVRAAPDGFDLTLELRAGDADPADVYRQGSAGRSFVESRGRVFLVERATRDRLAGAQRALAGDPARQLMHRSTHRVPRHRAAEVGELMEAVSPNFRPPAEWTAGAVALRNHSRLTMPRFPGDLSSTLRDYQKLGAAWLHHLHAQQLGGVLADEMGLGKTLQALAVLSTLGGTSLVVCPASLVENWRREAARFVPAMRVRVHHGSDRGEAGDFNGVDLVVTSYGTLVRDSALLERVEFECLIADEAQHAKNRRTQNAAALRGIRARGRLMLTGTPVENTLDDLRSLFEIALPGALKPIPADARGEERKWHEAHLRRQTAHFILRRTKAQVAPELPPKIEQTIHCEAGPAQRAFYESVRAATERDIEKLEFDGGKDAQVRLAVLTQLLRLRQVCCDPALLPGGAEAGSAKMEAFLELLDEAVDDGHRMLVFSQFTSLLGLVREELETRCLEFASIDGSMSPRERQREVDRFQASAEVPVFLISLKAGGTGLNLTGADTVVHFDPWWNPAVEAQATDRAHRIGQTRTVNVYKLIVAGTVEEKVLTMQQEKARLLADVFDESDAANARLSLADLRELAQGK